MHAAHAAAHLGKLVAACKVVAKAKPAPPCHAIVPIGKKAQESNRAKTQAPVELADVAMQLGRAEPGIRLQAMRLKGARHLLGPPGMEGDHGDVLGIRASLDGRRNGIGRTFDLVSGCLP